MNKRFVSTVAGSIVIAGALAVAVAQYTEVADANSPAPKLGVQEMTAGQMLGYMKEQGTKYIVETTEIPKDKKFEVNLKSANPDDVAKAIAKALSLKAVKEGDVWVFRADDHDFDFHFDHDIDMDHDHSGDMHFDFSGFPFDGSKAFFDESFLKEMKSFEGKDWDQMTPEERAKFDKAMEKMSKELQEKLGNMKIKLKGMSGDLHKLNDEKLKMLKEMNWDQMSPEEKAKFEKEMAELKKQLADAKVEINGFKSEELKKDLEQMKEEIKRSVKDGMRVHIENTDKLFKSISDSQWKLMETQGHLKVSDLTKAQLEMIGNPKGDGDFNISISRDGKKLVIKK